MATESEFKMRGHIHIPVGVLRKVVLILFYNDEVRYPHLAQKKLKTGIQQRLHGGGTPTTPEAAAHVKTYSKVRPRPFSVVGHAE